MDCTNIDSIIVTIAVQIHGKIINVNLSPSLQKTFENVRLFSRAGEFSDVMSNRLTETTILQKVNEMFQQNLTRSSLDVVKRYVEYSHPVQKRILIENYEQETTEQNRESVCQLYNNVTIDKIFGTNQTNANSTWLGRICYMFEVQGIFLVSVHEKRSESDYKLIYPPLNKIGTNMNLLNISDLQTFADMFHKELPDLISAPDTFMLPLDEYRKRKQQILEETSISENEKKVLIEKQHIELANVLSEWNIHMESPDKIEAIKMSKLVNLIKNIVGAKCKINILDYSCSSVAEHAQEQVAIATFKPSYSVGRAAIDTTSEDSIWGGKQTKTKKIKTKHKKRRKGRKGRKSRKLH